MEFWPGWFDHWGEKHKLMKANEVVGAVRDVLKSGASINFYMFHGKLYYYSKFTTFAWFAEEGRFG